MNPHEIIMHMVATQPTVLRFASFLLCAFVSRVNRRRSATYPDREDIKYVTNRLFTFEELIGIVDEWEDQTKSA
jgi:hypothetical protein